MDSHPSFRIVREFPGAIIYRYDPDRKARAPVFQ
jgi:hypothetical protein